MILYLRFSFCTGAQWAVAVLFPPALRAGAGDSFGCFISGLIPSDTHIHSDFIHPDDTYFNLLCYSLYIMALHSSLFAHQAITFALLRPVRSYPVF